MKIGGAKMKRSLKDPEVVLGVSIFGIVMSVVLLFILYFKGGAVWPGMILFFCNLLIYLSNRSKFKGGSRR